MSQESPKFDGGERALHLLAEFRRDLEVAAPPLPGSIFDGFDIMVAQVRQALLGAAPTVADPASSAKEVASPDAPTPSSVTSTEGGAAAPPASVADPAGGEVTPWTAPTFRPAAVIVAASPSSTLAESRNSPQPTPAPRIHAGAPSTQMSPPAAPVATAPKSRTIEPPAKGKALPPPKPFRLANGNVNRPYSARLDSLVKIPIERLEYLAAWPTGLALDTVGVLSGVPEIAGEYTIPWRRQGSSSAEGEFVLTVNPDPRSLWKNLPSDRADTFWKPDSDQCQASSASAHVAAASIRGRSHAHVGSFRDDDFGMHLPKHDDPYGWHLLCVADGAGSAKSSRRGSQIACDIVIKKLRELLIESPTGLAAELDLRSRDAATEAKADGAFWTKTLYHVLGTAAAYAQAAVRKEAEMLGASLKDFSTTLLVAIVRRTTKGAWFIGAYWVGDGAIGMWNDGWDAPKLFGEPESGEFAGQTTFFTSEDFSRAEMVQRRLRYTLVEDYGFLALMTDGISDPKFPTEQMLKTPESWAAFQTDLGEVLQNLKLGEPSTSDRLLAWMDFWSAGNHDDRTLLLMVPRAQAREIG